jgi:hypothetical protein
MPSHPPTLVWSVSSHLLFSFRLRTPLDCLDTLPQPLGPHPLLVLHTTHINSLQRVRIVHLHHGGRPLQPMAWQYKLRREGDAVSPARGALQYPVQLLVLVLDRCRTR